MSRARMSLTLTKTAITKLKPYFELFQKLGSLRFEPKACLLRALFSAWAFEPEPRLILPTAESQNDKSQLHKKLSRCRQRLLIRIKRLQNQLIRRIRHRISKSRFQRWSRHRKFLHQLVNLFALKLFLHSVFHCKIRLKPFPASFYVVLATSQNYRWV